MNHHIGYPRVSSGKCSSSASQGSADCAKRATSCYTEVRLGKSLSPDHDLRSPIWNLVFVPRWDPFGSAGLASQGAQSEGQDKAMAMSRLGQEFLATGGKQAGSPV
jgi:hypothetical protein